jgi:outer membrane protein TolC
MTGPLSLKQCIDAALANNPELLAGRDELDFFLAQRDIAAANHWPKLDVVGGYSDYLDPVRLAPAQYNGELGSFGRHSLGSDLVLSVSLFAGGQISNDIKAAGLQQEAAERRLARKTQELVFYVSRAFYGILAQEQMVKSLDFSRNAMLEHRNQVEQLLSAGKAAKVDLMRVEVRLADLEQKVLSARNVLRVQHCALAKLVGRPADQLPTELEGELSSTETEISPEESLLKAYESRSDYLAEQFTVKAQAARVEVARGAFWPSLSLQASYGGRWLLDPTEVPPGGEQCEDVGQVALSMKVPVFRGGELSSRLAGERAKLAAAQQRLREIRLRVRQEVETAVLNMDSAGERMRVMRKAIEQAEESLRIERERYRLSKGSVTDVLDAQAELLDAQTSYFGALVDCNVSIAQLRLAIGEEP